MIRQPILWLAFFILAIGLSLLQIANSYWTFLTWSPAHTMTTVITRGKGLAEIADQLQKQKVITSAYWMQIHAYWNSTSSLQAGEYRFEPGDLPPAILDRMHRGLVVRHKLVVPEGWSAKQIEQQLRAQGLMVAEVLDHIELRSRLPREIPSTEGWLFPDTYFFRLEDPPISILQRMLEKGRKVLNEEYAARAQEITLTPYQALILASVIEKETGQASERRRISGVFHNRMTKGMKLQSDPTVIYGIADFGGALTRRQLDTPTPFNTYTMTGLPITPICNPGREAIHATFHPEKTRDLFFVARGDGTHAFSETLEEHNRNVQRYQRSKKTTPHTSTRE